MIKISGIVITKNAENLIADCLDSLSFCEEVVVIDSKSEDRTKEIAEKMGAKVFEHSFQDFSEARNFGLEKATGEWVIYVDSDERVTKELVSSIEYQVLSIASNNFSAFKIKRKNFYFGSSKKNEWPYIERLERLFKKDKIEGWYGKLHESPRIKGEIGELDGYLFHYTHRDLSSMVKKTIEWSKIEAELRFKSGHPKMTWWRFPRVMITAFLDSYIRQGGWKIGTVGLIESMYQSFSIFVTYARLWELQQKNKKNEK
ncbi:MAG: glycosyltransferase family 2 protein [Candidatus Levybacteria bacterium]|nr:glycosyltransferase family 2 protein [Candidatus Levybacteria bacterium]